MAKSEHVATGEVVTYRLSEGDVAAIRATASECLDSGVAGGLSRTDDLRWLVGAKDLRSFAGTKALMSVSDIRPGDVTEVSGRVHVFLDLPQTRPLFILNVPYVPEGHGPGQWCREKET